MLGSMLVGVSVLDITTYVSAAGMLLTCAMIAAFVPARRAARLAPSDALRHE
jgi:ABC-type antimicrobial peptide transport system permease subunit